MPSPSGGFVPSPAAVNTMQQPSPKAGGPRGVPSGLIARSSPIDTPEDAAYFEKIRQLQKYIEPLRRMIAGMNAADKTNLLKMKKLYDILTNPQKKSVPMSTLLKSEEVLGKMFEKIRVGGDEGSSSVDHQGTNLGQSWTPGPPNSASGMNPLLESVCRLRSNEQKNHSGPALSHTLNRSMRAPLEAIFGNDITLPPLPKKLRLADTSLAIQSAHEDSPDIPDVLQGEVARLQPQFKVSLDPAQAATSGPRRRILLVCQLEDKDLPSVPPLSVTIPAGYPETGCPVCAGFSDDDNADDGDGGDGAVEYSFTPFLARVRDALTSRMSKMPVRFSLSQLLSAWEMSVRSACNVRPNTSTRPSPMTAAPLAAAAAAV